MMKNLGIFGATGSIGQSTLAVIRDHPEEFRVVVLTARSQQQKLAELIEEFQPAIAVIEEKPANELLSVAQNMEPN
jgi:1-deoxy-D-xylulose 5-phosphate reductoisomerase